MGEPLIRTKTGVILLAVFVLGGSFLFTLYGAVHAKKIKTSFHDISISKQADDLKEMKVVLIADLHLGYSVGSKDMEKMVDRINKQLSLIHISEPTRRTPISYAGLSVKEK